MSDLQNWSPQVIAALIAAVSALIVAAVQAAAGRRASQRIESLRGQLERQKQLQSEYLRKYLENFIEGKEQELQAFKELLQNVQSLRDKLKKVTENPNSYNVKTLKGEIAELSEMVLDTFARNQMHFSEDDCRYAHALKNMCRSMAVEFEAVLDKHKRGEPLSVPPELQSLQDEVGRLHNGLRRRAFAAAKVFTESLKSGVRAGEGDE